MRRGGDRCGDRLLALAAELECPTLRDARAALGAEVERLGRVLPVVDAGRRGDLQDAVAMIEEATRDGLAVCEAPSEAAETLFAAALHLRGLLPEGSVLSMN